MTRQVRNFRTVLFPVDLLDRLKPFAARRGLTANALVRTLVDSAIDEGVVEEILDGGPVLIGVPQCRV